MRPRVALVTWEKFPQLWDDDRLLVGALDEIGIDGQPAVWDDAGVDWSGFAAIVIRSPWDYFERVDREAFVRAPARRRGLLRGGLRLGTEHALPPPHNPRVGRRRASGQRFRDRLRTMSRESDSPELA